jgi:hypothetical protein
LLAGRIYFSTSGQLAELDPATKNVSELGVAAPRDGLLVAAQGELIGIEQRGWSSVGRNLRWKPGMKRFEPMAAGPARMITTDAKRVYWVDVFHGALMAAPR